jgi:hypothetical protein
MTLSYDIVAVWRWCPWCVVSEVAMVGLCCVRSAGIVLVAAGVAGVAGCTGGGHPAATVPVSTAVASGFSASELQGALLTRVNGVPAALPASSGRYASLPAATTDRQTTDGVRVTPAACTKPATEGFDMTALAAAPAAAVTFRVAGNTVSEVLVASAAALASAAIAAHVPAQCARYEEKAAGKTVKYDLTEEAVTGIGQQARALNTYPDGATSDNLWSLIYRGKGFVGTVTVLGPNASEQAVRELGQQAYAFAAKTLA